MNKRYAWAQPATGAIRRLFYSAQMKNCGIHSRALCQEHRESKCRHWCLSVRAIGFAVGMHPHFGLLRQCPKLSRFASMDHTSETVGIATNCTALCNVMPWITRSPCCNLFGNIFCSSSSDALSDNRSKKLSHESLDTSPELKHICAGTGTGNTLSGKVSSPSACPAGARPT